MLQRDKKWLRLAVLCSIPVLGGLAISRIGRERYEASRLMQSVPGGGGALHVSGSMWRSNERIVYVQDQDRTRLIEVNTRTGEEKALPPLPADERVAHNFGVSVSPDGRWLLWPGGSEGWRVRALDGGPVIKRGRLSDSLSDLKVAWLPDSSGWVEARAIHPPTGGTLDGMTLVTNRSILRVFKIQTPGTRDIDIHDAAAVAGVTVTKSNEAFVDCGTGEGVEFLRVPVSSYQRHSRSLTITPPIPHSEAFISKCVISPDGQRVAWVFQHRHNTPITESMAISNLDGTGFRFVSPEMSAHSAVPGYLHWRPDGQSLSGWSGDRMVVVHPRPLTP